MEDIQEVTQQCMNSGANITEIKTIRKRLSDVKGGRNQEIALSAAHGIRDLQNVVIFPSVRMVWTVSRTRREEV